MRFIWFLSFPSLTFGLQKRRLSAVEVTLFLLIVSNFHSFGQLPSKADKLIGTWEYQGGSGYEVWSENSGILHGEAYRINKIGDTSRVEEITLRKVNKQLIYTLQTNTIVSDSVVIIKNVFVGGKRKMEFFNVESTSPYSISYKTGFLNKNKLKIKIQYGPTGESVVLILHKVKD